MLATLSLHVWEDGKLTSDKWDVKENDFLNIEGIGQKAWEARSLMSPCPCGARHQPILKGERLPRQLIHHFINKKLKAVFFFSFII